MDANVKRTVVVTGFGPFGQHVVNASWEAVKELRQLCSNSMEFHDIEVVIKEIPVCYEYVTVEIPKLWKEYNPIVVLHIGVSYKAKCLTLENHAHSNGYKRKDIFNKCPEEVDVSPNILETIIDVKKICEIVNDNSTETGCKACVSHNAGRYLCEYIYYKSLSIGAVTLFVHVPDFNVYPTSQTARGLYHILQCILKDVKDN